MDCFVIAPESLIDIIKQITEKMLWTRLRLKAKCYIKMDFNILEQDEFFTIQMIKCGCGCPSLRLFNKTIKKHLDCSKLNNNFVLATVEKKRQATAQVWNIIYNKSGLMYSKVVGSPEKQKNLSAQKSYVSIKLSLQVHKDYLNMFSSSLLCYVIQLEQTDCNTKFILRRGKHYLYRNHVEMDDIILSCKILNSACTAIFQNSQDGYFKKILLDSLNIEKESAFEETAGCLLLAQVNSNFTVPVIKSKEL